MKPAGNSGAAFQKWARVARPIPAGCDGARLGWAVQRLNPRPETSRSRVSGQAPQALNPCLREKLFVPDAHVADYILCVARTRDGADKEDGISLFLVDAKSSGIKTEVLKTLTGQKLCEVVFSSVTVPKGNVLGELGKGWPIMKTVLNEATVAECAWIIGGAQWVLETSVDYAKERIQFGVPIGSFQAIQHKCANMAIDVEGAVDITYYVAWTVAENDPGIAMAASMAKEWCSDIYTRAAVEGIQIHGGIGFTWDHDMHLYLKRAKSSEVTWGNGDYHRDKMADMLGM